MVSTGIVRRVDDLGRVVIPKEIRQKIGIQEGEPLEFFIDNDNNIILKKYINLSEQTITILEDTIDTLLMLPVPPTDTIEQLKNILEDIDY